MKKVLCYALLFAVLLFNFSINFAQEEHDCEPKKVKVILVEGQNVVCAPEFVAKNWIRKGFAVLAEDILQQNTNTTVAEVEFSQANVPAKLPLHKGYYEGDEVYFIITDASEKKHAEIVTQKQGWKVELAPLLANAPAETLSRTYIFTNGVEGSGVHGYQGEVFTSTPAQPDIYSALTAHVHVTWLENSAARNLISEQEILAAEAAEEIALTELPVVMNMPHIVWPEGQMPLRENKEITDDMPYKGGQVVDINLEEMTVTFVAHRGWGPNGEAIYYIVTDTTPSFAADTLGVVNTPTSAKLLANSAAVDLFQFQNGIAGAGPMAAQVGIAAANVGSENYSPMWRIFLVSWQDPNEASMLTSIAEINELESQGSIIVNIAKPGNDHHIVNCPFIDPFQ